MTDTNWLAELKPGDLVIVLGGRRDVVSTVMRLTPTQIIVGEMKFRKDSGRLIGANTWHSAWLEPYTLEKDNVIQLVVLRERLIAAFRDIQGSVVRTLDHDACCTLLATLTTFGLRK